MLMSTSKLLPPTASFPHAPEAVTTDETAVFPLCRTLGFRTVDLGRIPQAVPGAAMMVKRLEAPQRRMYVDMLHGIAVEHGLTTKN